jgi:hypothetical protein
MTPPGDSFEYAEGPDFNRTASLYVVLGFESLLADADWAAHSISPKIADAVWCKASLRGARVKGFRLAFLSSNRKGKMETFELLITESMGTRSLVRLTAGKFTVPELESFRAEFGGGKC